jgi:hypothetical protein
MKFKSEGIKLQLIRNENEAEYYSEWLKLNSVNIM